MDYKLLGGKLERLVELARGWKVRGANELERDLALELLRGAYTEIRFGSMEAESGPETEAVIDVGELEGEGCQVVAGEIAQEPAEVVAREDFAWIEAESEAEPGSESKIGMEPETGIEAEHKAESEEHTTVVRRLAPDVIRSLYDSDKVVVAGGEREAGTGGGEEKEYGGQALERKTTLGDVIAQGRKTLGEALGSRETVHGREKPVAGGDRESGAGVDSREKGGAERDDAREEQVEQPAQRRAAGFAREERAGLRRSIGLNDRYTMIRDMFDGDAAAFDEAISRLDTFTDLDEAIIFMHDNYHWSADNTGTARLVELLERKLG